MDTFDDDETCTRLKNSLDIKDLRDPNGQGVEFEVDEQDLVKEGDAEKDTDLQCFEKNKVAANLCLLSDNEDDDNNVEDGEYFTEKERLERRLRKIPDSDITSKKDAGILKELKTPGVGAVVPENALVCFHYNAYIDVGQAPCDSSRLRDQAEKVRLGKGNCILGLELALLSMKKHETSRFLIHYNYGYGEMGCPPRIPKETTLIFDIEVIYFVEQDGVEDYQNMTMEERRRLPFAEVEKGPLKSLKGEGREYFKQNQYGKALAKYRKMEDILNRYQLKNDEEEKRWKELILGTYLNTANCHHMMKHHGSTITFCNNALQHDRKSLKAHYLKGMALYGKGEFLDAEKSLKEAFKLAPTNKKISDALKDLAKKKKEAQEFDKLMYQRMFSQPIGAADDNKNKPKTDTVTETEVKAETCSPKFQAHVQKHLESFKNDPHLSEWPFPENLTEKEIAFILETADDLGLSFKKRGTGSSVRYEVYKNKL